MIPCKANKRPFLTTWAEFQSRLPTAVEVRTWWTKHPIANIGIITGKLSGLTVVDCDSPEAWEQLGEFLPDSLMAPVVLTPSENRQIYFKHAPGLHSQNRIMPDLDIKTDGGYVIAPPSACEYRKNGKNIKGGHRWQAGEKCGIPAMPELLFAELKKLQTYCGAVQARDPRAQIKTDSIPYLLNENDSVRGNVTLSRDMTGQKRDIDVTKSDKRDIGFTEGVRDETLFHVATCLHRGGMTPENIASVLHFLGAHCSPPFPDAEIREKIKSVFDRDERTERNLMAEIRDFVSVTSGQFSVTECDKEVGIRDKRDMANRRKVISRLVAEKVIEPVGNKNGVYRKVEDDCPEIDWTKADTSFLKIWLPFELDRIAGVQPGNILCFAGAKDSGKTACLMNMAYENRERFKVHYFSSEMGPAEFKLRAMKYPHISPDQWGIGFHERADNFEDVIRRGPGNLNIIDFLEIHENFYLISKTMASLHSRLEGALAVIAIQKDPHADLGRGGSFSLEKPRLYVALDHGRAKVISCKNFRPDSITGNPRGKEYTFKLIDGCRFKKEQGWHEPLAK